MSKAIRIHTFAKSGHAHRVALFASVAGIDHTLNPVDLAKGEHKKEPFLTLNPAGQVPVIEDGDIVVSDSNAILVYLARKYAPSWIPSDPVDEAEVQKFLTLAAGPIAYGPAAARRVTVFGARLDVENAKSIATTAFDMLENHLEERDWLVDDKPTIADIAIYSYTAHAPEGNVSLDPYPNVRHLLTNIESLKGFVAMPATAVGLVA